MQRAPVDVPGPDRDGDVAGPRAVDEERRSVLEPGHPARGEPRPHVAERIDDELPGDPGRRAPRAPGRRPRRRRRPPPQAPPRARAPSEASWSTGAAGRARARAPPRLLARRRDRRPQLLRVVRVVVVHAHPAGLADELEPAPDPLEPRKRRSGLVARRRPPARAPPAPSPRSAGCARRARRARSPPARAPTRARPPAPRAATRSNSASTSAREPNSAWWSRSTFVHHRDLRPQRRNRAVGLVPLDDEPALPRAGVRAELRNLAADDPARVAPRLPQRERDHRRGRRLPVRAGDDDRRRRRDELREQVGTRPARHRRDTRTRRTPPTRRAPRAPATPAPRSPRRAPGRGTASRSGPSRRPRRPSRARAAPYADSPAPPMPTSQIRPTARAGKRDQLLRDLVGSLGLRGRAASPRPSPRAAPRRRAARARPPARAPISALGHDDHAARLLEVARVLRLVVVRHVRGRDEHRRLRRRRHLPDRAARAREREIAGVERRVEIVRPGEQFVVRAGNTAPSACEVPLAAEVQDRRPFLAEPGERDLVQRGRAQAAAEDEQHLAARAGRPKRARASSRGTGSARSTGRPTTRNFGPLRTGYARKTRRANREASRFASPRCASASDSAAGIRFAARPRRPSAPPRTRRRRTRRPAAARRGSAAHALGACPASSAARSCATPGRRGSPEIRNASNS